MGVNMAENGPPESMTAAAHFTDEQLLVEFQRGERSALAELVGRHEARLARIAYRITGCRHEAEDVRHTVFVRFLQALDRLLELKQVGAWLTRCTVNEAVTRTRQRCRDGRAIAQRAQNSSAAMDNSPLESLQQDEIRGRLAAAIVQLEPGDRALVSLRFDEDLTFREIAEVLERPASTVKTQMAHVITRLRALLGPIQ
jgi:RNA polymerase sigma-70 factor, ECF subfamily